jgi:hypothetical protein
VATPKPCDSELFLGGFCGGKACAKIKFIRISERNRLGNFVGHLIERKTNMVVFDVHVTLHHDKFSYNKTN